MIAKTDFLTLPNLLTIIRLITSSLCLPFFLVYFLPWHSLWINSGLAIVFVAVSLTDFFDGYFARRYAQESDLGKLLDPIADKFLLYATLTALLAAHKIFFGWVIILIGREFFLMGLRHVALSSQFVIPVSYLGKGKTLLQMVCLTFIIINPYQALGIKQAFWWNSIELTVLILTNVLSLVSAHHYYMYFIAQLNDQKEKEE
jgi:CDP-diacylglycerol--glycerol-3-phosphate 3-phosphatidyltransferase